MIKVVLPSRINTGTVVSRITFALKKKKKKSLRKTELEIYKMGKKTTRERLSFPDYM